MKSSAVLAVLPAVLLALCLSACSEKHTTRPVTDPLPPPVPNSPAGAVRLFEWCWDQRDVGHLAQLLADDSHFAFPPEDSAGYDRTPPPLTRVGLLSVATNLFEGRGTLPGARRIALQLDSTLQAFSDSRPGKDPRWHKQVLTSSAMTIELSDGRELRVEGPLRFFLVRGDSALVPFEHGAADSTAWFLERWEEGVIWCPLAAARPPVLDAPLTWSDLLVLYR